MDIKQIRTANINYLADKHGRERIVECDERNKWTINYVNQLCGGFGSFGMSTARRIERGLGLDYGWVDLMHPSINYESSALLTDDASKAQLSNLWDRMTPDERAQLIKIGAALCER